MSSAVGSIDNFFIIITHKNMFLFIIWVFVLIVNLFLPVLRVRLIVVGGEVFS
jgi:hypothetical protein